MPTEKYTTGYCPCYKREVPLERALRGKPPMQMYWVCRDKGICPQRTECNIDIFEVEIETPGRQQKTDDDRFFPEVLS